MKHRKVLLTTLASILTIGIVSGAVALNSTPQKAGADDTPIVKQLSDQDKKLSNHEARITNTENNVQAVADKTGTSTTTVVQVPVPATSPVESTPAPQAPVVTVVSYQEIPIGISGDTDCKLVYSDGTTYQWHWIINKYGTITTGSCDASVIGTAKS